MIIVDIAIVALLLYTAYTGTKRGAVLIGLELVSFIAATVVALLGYHLAGAWVKALIHLATPLSNVVGFIAVWVVIEISSAVIIRLTLLRRLTRHIQLSIPNQIGGSFLNVVKWLLIVLLSLIVFAGLPLSASTKQVIIGAYFPRHLLASTTQLQSWLGHGLGHDLGDSLNFFTVTAEPESEQRIELGYTTTGSPDPADEEAMLGLINHERTTRGLSPLTMNTQARQLARSYSAEMFAQGYFSHIDPQGHTPFDRMRAAGIRFDTAGENLALAPTLPLAHQGLMNSPGHRANILSPNYHTVGIGIIDGGPYGLMITQDFTD